MNSNCSNPFFYLSASISLTKYMQTIQAENKLISSTITLVLEYLGIDGLEFALSSVAGTMETASGVGTVTDATLPRTVLKAKNAKASMAASQNFYEEWKASMAVPIDAISKRFSHLKTADRPVVVTPQVPSEAVTALHTQLESIDATYPSAVFLKDHLKKVPKMLAFIDTHVAATPYSY